MVASGTLCVFASSGAVNDARISGVAFSSNRPNLTPALLRDSLAFGERGLGMGASKGRSDMAAQRKRYFSDHGAGRFAGHAARTAAVKRVLVVAQTIR